MVGVIRRANLRARRERDRAEAPLDCFGGVQGGCRGVDLRPLQALPGGSGRPTLPGRRLSLAVIDGAFELSHPAIRPLAARATVLGELSRRPAAHAASVLSILASPVLAPGGTLGAAPEVERLVLSPVGDGAGLVGILAETLGELSAGDVLAVPWGFAGPGPIAGDGEIADLLVEASRRRIVPVVAAGNAGRELREPTAGALVVGATTPRLDRALGNHGAGVDCVAWGAGVPTAGYLGSGRPAVFEALGGSSLATAIVAGGLLAVQSALWSAGRPLLDLPTCKSLLAVPGLSCPTAPRGTPLPDLHALWSRLTRAAWPPPAPTAGR